VLAHDDGGDTLIGLDVVPDLEGEVGDQTDPLVSDDVTKEGVFEAALIILADGDLEEAIAAGLVTEAEIDAALAAIDNGTIDQYLD
jgi:hypothetical protein